MCNLWIIFSGVLWFMLYSTRFFTFSFLLISTILWFTSWMLRLRTSTVVCSSLFDNSTCNIAEHKLYTDLCAKSQPSTRGCEDADFPNLTLILWAWQGASPKSKLPTTGIPVVCTTYPCHAPSGSDARTKKNRTCFYVYKLSFLLI